MWSARKSRSTVCVRLAKLIELLVTVRDRATRRKRQGNQQSQQQFGNHGYLPRIIELDANVKALTPVASIVASIVLRQDGKNGDEAKHHPRVASETRHDTTVKEADAPAVRERGRKHAGGSSWRSVVALCMGPGGGRRTTPGVQLNHRLSAVAIRMFLWSRVASANSADSPVATLARSSSWTTVKLKPASNVCISWV